MVVIDNVSKEYANGKKAVDGVSLSVPKGETLVLVGTSGCGKTTTLKMINQLIKHTSGQIFVGGQDVSTMNPVLLRRKIGYVIQQVGLMPHLDIMNNITFVLQITNQPKARLRARAEEMLDVVGLPISYLKRFPRELSGGEQQRIGVARALAADPDIILMDEPFGAVDPITRDQLQKELLRLQQKLHKTIIFVTHDIQEAFRLGNRIGVMRAGKLVTVAKPIDLVLKEAAKGIGASDLQLLTRVELPLAFPVIFAGIKNMVVMNIAIATIAVFVGAGGLGDIILKGIRTFNDVMMISGTLIIALVAILVERIFALYDWRLNRSRFGK